LKYQTIFADSLFYVSLLDSVKFIDYHLLQADEKVPEMPFFVISVKAGIQSRQSLDQGFLDHGWRLPRTSIRGRGDDARRFFYTLLKVKDFCEPDPLHALN
jgi:hypothetical protein